MKWTRELADYFQFTRRDRIAILTILVLIIGIFFLPELIPGKSAAITTAEDSAWLNAMKKIQFSDSSQEYAGKTYRENEANEYNRPVKSLGTHKKGELFYFDPNKLTNEGWQRLGLREKTIGTIRNYLSKGGRFRKPEDLQRVYGLFPDEYERLAPYIRIAEQEQSFTPRTEYASSENKNAKRAAPRYALVDINSADTSAFIALPGIGNKLANRIILFRDKLGGFYSIEQVGETFGLPDSTFQKIKQWLKLENTSLRKININTASLDELKAHPYIRYALANPIIAYRKEHGSFATMEDLKNVMAVTEVIYDKLAPYLSLK